MSSQVPGSSDDGREGDFTFGQFLLIRDENVTFGNVGSGQLDVSKSG